MHPQSDMHSRRLRARQLRERTEALLMGNINDDPDAELDRLLAEGIAKGSGIVEQAAAGMAAAEEQDGERWDGQS